MKILCKLIFKPFIVIKGQVFCRQWTGDKRLNITGCAVAQALC